MCGRDGGRSEEMMTEVLPIVLSKSGERFQHGLKAPQTHDHSPEMTDKASKKAESADCPNLTTQCRDEGNPVARSDFMSSSRSATIASKALLNSHTRGRSQLLCA